MTLDRELTDLGLSPKEAKVYLSLLELGTASAQAIARRAGIVRPTTYVILETLARKGLASRATGPDAKKMIFAAEAPERLEHFLEHQARDIQRRQKDLERILPELHSFQLAGEEKPRVRMFEGKEGLKSLQHEFVGVSKDEMVGMVSEDVMEEIFPLSSDEFDRDIRSVRVRAGVFSRHIYVTSRGPTARNLEADKRALRERRYLPPELLPISASFAVHGPVLSIVSLRDKIIGVLIEHADIANSFRGIFEFLWKTAEMYQQKDPVAEKQQEKTPLTVRL
ncbi:MAG: transcriptional regulator TrmB [Parcubacteria group bacterium Gr01-1014_106]|nr:MAG: transcriptional regulator TrmB [Parcubacteria group bacterium Gr01-1014_106]